MNTRLKVLLKAERDARRLMDLAEDGKVTRRDVAEAWSHVADLWVLGTHEVVQVVRSWEREAVEVTR